MRRSWLLVLPLLLGGALWAGAAPIGPGAEAPALEGDQWIQDGRDIDGPSADELAGKVVVIEFWAYW